MSCSFLNSSTQSGGRRSALVEAICPSFMKVGPSSSNTRRTRTGVESPFAFLDTNILSRAEKKGGNIRRSRARLPKPYLMRVTTMLLSLRMFLNA